MSLVISPLNDTMEKFNLVSEFKPAGDQVQAISGLVKNLEKNKKHQILLGVTGSGKTYTMANVIAQTERPALVISHNKTLAAQLYSEFREFFPQNKVRYFVSYYDYYQPEAYLPDRDIYIEKDSSVNDDIDRLRLSATSSVLSARDVIIIASVSCIYPIGSPEDQRSMMLRLTQKQIIGRKTILKSLVQIQYERNEFELQRGTFRVRGNIIELVPSYEEIGIRLSLLGEEVVKLEQFIPLTGEIISREQEICIYPAKHFVTPPEKIKHAIVSIKQELHERCSQLTKEGKLLESQRLSTRTHYDLEMLQELGFCHGIENYSRHLSGRLPGERPDVLLDYFPDDCLIFIDEAHVTVPQLRGMYLGDKSRKETLVQYGFRLPSALDNRPLKFNEFESLANQLIYVSATPGKYELEKCGMLKIGEKSPLVLEQIIRPTGLLEPTIIVKPTKHQMDDLIGQIRKRVRNKQRVLVITISKNLAEEITDYLKDFKINVQYIHYQIETLERIDILKSLREAKFDVLVGINLLREGLDLPEVSLVAILDADKEGFLRSETSLIQISGRAARSIDGTVIMYADRITGSMKRAIEETDRRRRIQTEYNKSHGIKPASIKKPIYKSISEIIGGKNYMKRRIAKEEQEEFYGKDLSQIMRKLEKKMMSAAKQLDFEQAISYRERIKKFKNEK